MGSNPTITAILLDAGSEILYDVVMELTRKQKGDIAEAEVLIHFIKLGYEVYQPATDNAKYDMLISDGGQILRVSVKFCNSQHKSGSWKVTMSNVSRRIDRVQTDLFDSSLYDLIAVYVYQEDRVVVVPASKATPNILTIPRGNMAELV